MPIIEIDHLTKDYGHNRGIFDVSFSVEKGEVYGFLGPNGAGKTSTIRHIMGFSRPQQGRTSVHGLDSWERASDIQRELGYLPGEIALPESLTGTEFIRMMADLRGISDMAHTRALMKKFELDASGSLKRMSLGMKRKLAIVTAFMHDPAVLVLDEPTSGLDPIMQTLFIDFIKEEKAKGKTILISSHIFSEIDATCDSISIIKDGRLISSFVADDLRHNEIKTYELEFKTEAAFKRFSDEAKTVRQLEVLSLTPRKLQATLSVHDKDINSFVSFITGFEVKFFSEIKFTLEDYFMKFYDRSSKATGGAGPDALH
ncbi:MULTISPECIES: ATP-binding cassette domain-containing protein [unclassified Paenibacillus]|uniref:ABC transporter ATP-binding protein n=1 Tax=unclassified Paenibacillus TaxID=185978 RepID=UPI000957045F|nr:MULTISPECIES: ATP-binding cassette domain-containing protein [unclassified Paenibacillus]ASS65362.1 ATP-binding cassette domain-containing protein [Paenibacillus sp. RUD330]SIQ38706.1 ABC-2 type transport system ATP-binding protein [Paenibacillus sp. RU4X]SIQ60893.1 ABC-2 type transport system ATP-binding protein [Paenibacillus sp. RU4T]